jgi:outer membrane protein OmpA-like peptidoglycan-associated protein
MALLALCGCVSLPTGPSMIVLPGSGKSFDNFQADDAACRQWAGMQIGQSPQEIANQNTATGSVAGTLIGAGLGAAIGAAWAAPGIGAAIGAASGLLVGTAAGANAGQAYGWDAQRRYDFAYQQCMYSKGNQIPGVRRYHRVRYIMPPPPPASREEYCMTLNIEFDTDKAVIKPAYFKEVKKVANFMEKYPQVKGTIEGYTDSVGSAQYNLRLSQRRAESVVNMLVEKYGINVSRLSAIGYGSTRPIADNQTKEGRQINRRTVANFGCVLLEK